MRHAAKVNVRITARGARGRDKKEAPTPRGLNERYEPPRTLFWTLTRQAITATAAANPEYRTSPMVVQGYHGRQTLPQANEKDLRPGDEVSVSVKVGAVRLSRLYNSEGREETVFSLDAPTSVGPTPSTNSYRQQIMRRIIVILVIAGQSSSVAIGGSVDENSPDAADWQSFSDEKVLEYLDNPFSNVRLYAGQEILRRWDEKKIIALCEKNWKRGAEVLNSDRGLEVGIRLYGTFSPMERFILRGTMEVMRRTFLHCTAPCRWG